MRSSIKWAGWIVALLISIAWLLDAAKNAPMEVPSGGSPTPRAFRARIAELEQALAERADHSGDPRQRVLEHDTPSASATVKPIPEKGAQRWVPKLFTASIHGFFRTREGIPYGRSDIGVSRMGRSEIEYRSFTTEEGYYEFILPPGEYNLFSDYNLEDGSWFRLAADTVLYKDFVIDVKFIVIPVVDADTGLSLTSSLDDLPRLQRPPGTRDYETDPVAANANGLLFEAERLPDGEYGVDNGESYVSDNGTLRIAQGKPDRPIRLRIRPRILLRVEGPWMETGGRSLTVWSLPEGEEPSYREYAVPTEGVISWFETPGNHHFRLESDEGLPQYFSIFVPERGTVERKIWLP